MSRRQVVFERIHIRGKPRYFAEDNPKVDGNDQRDQMKATTDNTDQKRRVRDSVSGFIASKERGPVSGSIDGFDVLCM